SLSLTTTLVSMHRAVPYPAPLALPTRRSSDLRPNRAHEEEHHEADDDDGLGQGLRDLVQRVGHEDRRVIGHLHVDVARQMAYDRSEEHTSELQSPDHHVCRLLLEKKNETSTNN